jgi:hypothetical protein
MRKSSTEPVPMPGRLARAYADDSGGVRALVGRTLSAGLRSSWPMETSCLSSPRAVRADELQRGVRERVGQRRQVHPASQPAAGPPLGVLQASHSGGPAARWRSIRDEYSHAGVREASGAGSSRLSSQLLLTSRQMLST